MTFFRLLSLMVLVFAALAGCKGKASEEPGYSKSDFAPRPAPAGYGPPGGPASQPPTTGGGK